MTQSNTVKLSNSHTDKLKPAAINYTKIAFRLSLNIISNID